MPATGLTQALERFLASIPLEHYREELMPIKTVEQDLPRLLNPLPGIYETYWVSRVQQFPSYEEFFEAWWQGHLTPLDPFIRQFFWGCSYSFVQLGFKARLYRTIISVLTQFHFAYLWNDICSLPIEASAELDMRGIDVMVKARGQNVALSVKKETYRPEARGEGRFGRRGWEGIKAVVEVPYTVNEAVQFQRMGERARKGETRDRYRLSYFLADRLQRRLPNSFVVFRPDYPKVVEELVRQLLIHKTPQLLQKVSWEETLKFALKQLA